MNDKALLELAAKAAGYSTSKYWHNDGIHCGTEYEYTDGPHGWNPLTDDGDALRLAVKLGISIHYVAADDGKTLIGVLVNDCELEEINEIDICKAARRAITRAAAELGKAK
jgi:hypothetical protein